MNFANLVWVYLQTTLWIFCLLLRFELAVHYCKLAIVLTFGIATSIYFYILPITGFLSFTSLTLLMNCVSQRFNWPVLLSKSESYLLFMVIVFASCILYPSSLGLWNYTAYNWGFNSIIFPFILGTGAQIAWWYNYRKLAVLGLAILWVWLLNLSTSQNLWDYLIDPWVVIYAFYALEKSIFARQYRNNSAQ